MVKPRSRRIDGSSDDGDDYESRPLGLDDAGLRVGLGLQVFLWVTAGLSVVGFVLVGLWLLAGRPSVAGQPNGLQPSVVFDGVKIAFAVVAGIGGVVGLVVAYRKQRLSEADHIRQDRAQAREDTNLWNERFGKAAEQLGSDKATIRLAGVYAMASLADDWLSERQTCIDVLCAYIRRPYKPVDPAPDLPEDPRRNPYTFKRFGDLESFYDPQQEGQVRAAIMATLSDHLSGDSDESWAGHSLDFTGAMFEAANFEGTTFNNCNVNFDRCLFYGESWFSNCTFIDSRVSFVGAIFAGRLSLEYSEFMGSTVLLYGEALSDSQLTLQGIKLHSGTIEFTASSCKNGDISFISSQLEGGEVKFHGPKVRQGQSIAFSRATISGTKVTFERGEYQGGNIHFNGVEISGSGQVEFTSGVDPWGRKLHYHQILHLSGGEFHFNGLALTSGGALEFAKVIFEGSILKFNDIIFSGGRIAFRECAFDGGNITFDQVIAESGELLFVNNKYSKAAVVNFNNIDELKEVLDAGEVPGITSRVPPKA